MGAGTLTSSFIEMNETNAMQKKGLGTKRTKKQACLSVCTNYVKKCIDYKTN